MSIYTYEHTDSGAQQQSKNNAVSRAIEGNGHRCNNKKKDDHNLTKLSGTQLGDDNNDRFGWASNLYCSTQSI